MRREAFVLAARRLAHVLRAEAALVRLDLAVVTGHRVVLLLAAEAAVFAAFVLAHHLGEEVADVASFYNRTVLLPGLVPAIALGMGAVMVERDVRHLEMTFASSAGRTRAWAVRLGAVLAACAASSALLAPATALAVPGSVPPVAAALHATLVLAFVAMLATFLSVAFNGAAAAGLVTTAIVAAGGTLLHAAGSRWDPFLNPFAPGRGVTDAAAWFRTLVFNRTALIVAAALCAGGTLALLRRRERLLA